MLVLLNQPEADGLERAEKQTIKHGFITNQHMERFIVSIEKGLRTEYIDWERSFPIYVSFNLI